MITLVFFVAEIFPRRSELKIGHSSLARRFNNVVESFELKGLIEDPLLVVFEVVDRLNHEFESKLKVGIGLKTCNLFVVLFHLMLPRLHQDNDLFQGRWIIRSELGSNICHHIIVPIVDLYVSKQILRCVETCDREKKEERRTQTCEKDQKKLDIDRLEARDHETDQIVDEAAMHDLKLIENGEKSDELSAIWTIVCVVRILETSGVLCEKVTSHFNADGDVEKAQGGRVNGHHQDVVCVRFATLVKNHSGDQRVDNCTCRF